MIRFHLGFEIELPLKAKQEEYEDLNEPLIIESNFSEMVSELAVIQIESESQKLDRSQSVEEINVIHQNLPHHLIQNMAPSRSGRPTRARGVSLDPAFLLRRYSEIIESQTIFEF